MFQQVFDMKQIDELAKAQLLWFCADYTGGNKPYKWSGHPSDLPSDHYARGYYQRQWRYYLLLEE